MFYFLTLFGAKLGQPCIYNYCQGGASGCFRTKHQGAEGNWLPPGGGRALAFGIGPSALGADQQGGGVGALCRNLAQKRRGKGFFEEVAVGGDLFQAALESDRGSNLGDTHAARLLAAFTGDTGPAFPAFLRGFEEALLGAGGFHGKDAVDAEFGGLLDDPFEAIEFDEAGAEGDGDRRENGGKGLDDPKLDVLAAGFGDFSEVSLLIIGNLEALSRLYAQDAGEVASFVATQLRGPAANRIYKESTPCQTS